MGPPIRHLTSLLRRADAATKILLIVSDGRPYDLDYGQQYGDSAVLFYAVADTAKALQEARTAGVRPYLVTIDPAGGDYLSDMADPREYHVISNALDLPNALASLYLVARASS
jgi:nitric oxide reductase activation protein